MNLFHLHDHFMSPLNDLLKNINFMYNFHSKKDIEDALRIIERCIGQTSEDILVHSFLSRVHMHLLQEFIS